MSEALISPESEKPLSNFPAFTYFIGPEGVIYYSKGIPIPGSPNQIEATAVYFPDELGSKVSTHLGTPVCYQKQIIDGDSQKLPPSKDSYLNVFDTISPHPIFEKPTLTVDQTKVTGIFDPFIALRTIVDGNSPYPDILRSRLLQEIEVLCQVGIPYESIGLYGSLQVGLLSEGPDPYSDIDIIIQGTEHYQSAINLAHQYHNGYHQQRKSFVNGERNHRIRMRRYQLSKLHFVDSQGKGFHSDIRVVAAPNERIIIPPSTELADESVIINGQVESSGHSLGYPQAWEVTTNQGSKVSVLSNSYDFIGAATTGDQVQVNGRFSTDGQTIFLTDNQGHYIVDAS